jgi:GNAT superfamily N-acetyltransferase
VLRVLKAQVGDSIVLARMNKQLIEDEGHRNPMSIAELRVRMEGWLRSKSREAVFFVREDGERIGYALYQWRSDSFNPNKKFVYLRQFYVARENRRHDVGSEAFSALTKGFWVGASRIEVEVLTGNAVGIAFWHSLGFKDYQLGLTLNL